MRSIFLLVFGLAACATSGPPEDPSSTERIKTTIGPRETIDLTQQQMVKETVFTKPRSAVWPALLEANAALGFTLESADEASGRATFAARDRSRIIARRPASTLIDCGQGSAGARTESYRLTIVITHRLVDVPAGTSLRSVVEASARNPALSGDPVVCSSTGRLEAEIATNMTVRLK
jgi:hypothetical protein